MRPVRLTMQGIRSYRRRTEIDFADLDIFAIIGDTGAGKSTILEAISFALYGRKTWQGTKKNDLIADGVGVMAIELEFLADGHSWHVTRTVHRNATASVHKLECTSLAIKVDGSDDVNAKVRELVGLDHAQFTSAVVLPQGRFDRFLQATPAERSKLLKSIFGLDHLSQVSKIAEDLKSETFESTVTLRVERDQMGHDPTSAAHSIARELDDARVDSDKLASASGEANASRGQRDALARQVSSLRTALASVVEPPTDTGEQMQTLMTTYEQIERERADLAGEIRDVARKLDAFEASGPELLCGFAERDDLVAAHRQLRDAAARTEADIQNLEQLQHQLEQLGSEPSTSVDDALVEGDRRARQHVERCREDLLEATSRLTQGTELWNELERIRNKSAQLDTELSELTTQIGELASEIDQQRKNCSAFDEALGSARRQLDDALIESGVAAIAHRHRPHDPCPVCHRELPEGFVAPEQLDLEPVRAAVTAAERTSAQAAQRLASTQHQRERSSEQRQAVLADRNLLFHQIEDLQRRGSDQGLKVQAERVEEATAVLADAVSDAEQALRSAQQEADHAQQAVTAAELAQQGARSSFRERRGALLAQIEVSQSEIMRSVEMLNALPTELDPAGERLSELSAHSDRVASMHRLERTVSEALERLRRHDAQRATVEGQLREHTAAVSSLETKLSDEVLTPARRIAASVDQSYLSVNTAIKVAGLDSDAHGQIGSVRTMLEDALTLADLERLAGAVALTQETFDEIRQSASDHLEILETQHAHEESRLEEVLASYEVTSCEMLATRAGESRQRVLHLQQLLIDAQRTADRAERLDEVLVIAEPYLANLSVLIAALRDGQFVNALVAERESELLHEAGLRFQAISHGRYGFGPGFQIVRLATGETRGADTLSGGERFQAALALALALVEIASRGAGKLEAIFVDEGFGTLDRTSLDVALDTLATVAVDGKMVALISHLRQVAEYVDSVVHITRDDTTGSTAHLLNASEREAFLDEEALSGLSI